MCSGGWHFVAKVKHFFLVPQMPALRPKFQLTYSQKRSQYGKQGTVLKELRQIFDDDDLLIAIRV